METEPMPSTATDRRAFLGRALAVGGGVGGAALLAACGSKKGTATGATTSTSMSPSAGDVVLLRTASALEELEIAIWKQGLASGAIKTPSVVDTVKVLQAQHQQHAGVFDGHTSRLRGQPYTSPHPVLLAQLQPRLTDEASYIRAAVDAALTAAATYQAALTAVKDKRLTIVMASVAGVEARHAALLGTMVGQQLPTASLATTERAAPPV
jgi:hypothetical protein